MIIDLIHMIEEEKPGFKGGEGSLHTRMFSDESAKIMRGRLQPGASIGLHTHDTSSEIIFFLEGTATILYDGQTEVLTAGQCHYCPKGHSHTMMNQGTEDLVFYAAVPEL